MITDPDIATAVMELLSDSGVDYAVLHREDDLTAGCLTSDIDVVVDRPPRAAARRMLERTTTLRCICFYEYDIGAVSTFWSDARGRSVAQLDQMCDPGGLGFYGLKTAEVLQTAGVGDRWSRASRYANLSYLASKRLHKGELGRLDPEDVLDLRRAGVDGLARYLVPARRETVLKALAGTVSKPRFGLGAHLRRLARMIRRIARPCGTWVHIEGPEADEIALQLQRTLNGYLPRICYVGSLTAVSLARVIAGRFRPNLWITEGPRRCRFADGSVDSSAAQFDDVLDQVISTMDHRTRQLLGTE